MSGRFGTLVRIELGRCIKSKRFAFIIIFNVVIIVLLSIWVYQNIYLSNMQMRNFILLKSKTESSLTYHEWTETGILSGWIGCDEYSPYSAIFFILFPLIAAIPYGRLLHYELRSGYAKQILSRCKRSEYFGAKYVTAFLSGGLAVSIPLLISLCVAACYLPNTGADRVTMQGLISNKALWADLYYHNPVFYALAYICLDFVFGGLFACLALAISAWCKNGFVAVIFPLLLDIAFTKILSDPFPVNKLMVGNVIDPGIGSELVTADVIIIALIMLAICTLLYALNKRKMDILE